MWRPSKLPNASKGSSGSATMPASSNALQRSASSDLFVAGGFVDRDIGGGEPRDGGGLHVTRARPVCRQLTLTLELCLPHVGKLEIVVAIVPEYFDQDKLVSTPTAWARDWSEVRSEYGTERIRDARSGCLNLPPHFPFLAVLTDWMTPPVLA